MEKKVYQQLRSHKRAKSRNAQRVNSNTDDDRFDYHDTSDSDTRERLNEFSLEEVRDLLYGDGIAQEFLGLIGQGKEANVYYIKDLQKRMAAVKLFRFHTTSHNFNSMHARSKMSDTAILGIAENLCLKEWMNLNYLYEAKVRVPEPFSRHEFVFTMQLLGDTYGPSPLLREVNLKRLPGGKNTVVKVLDEILEQLDIMFNEAEMVHGDFSEHNIVWHEGEPWIIDFLQSQRYHPKFETPDRIRKRDALKILRKDIDHILNYFWRNYQITYDLDTVYKAIAGDVEDWSADELLSEFADPKAKEQTIREMRYDIDIH